MKEFFQSTLAILIGLCYLLSIPLAFIFGTKLDVALAFIIPLYGVFVMLGSIVSG